MADLLYLSYWLRGFSENNMLRWFETTLRRFPFSAASRGVSSLRIYAIEYAEPPLLETYYDAGANADVVRSAAAEFRSPDCAYLAGGYWDLWQQEGKWKLIPAPVVIGCYGPDFQRDLDDHVRLEIGLDSHFLPHAEQPASAAMVKSNIQSVLRLARELDGVLPVLKRSLWTESGEDFAERLRSLAG